MEELIIKLLAQSGVAGDIELSKPPKPEMGDFAFACFSLARAKGVSPVDAAKDLAKRVADLKSQSLEKIVPTGPYVNFFIKPESAAKEIIGEVLKKKSAYGFNSLGKGRKILLEYPSNNTHKEIHVGHLRNICIGNSLVKLFEAGGYKALPVNYINDFGAHVALCLWGILKFHSNDKLFASFFKRSGVVDKQKLLGEIYAEASHYLKEHPESKDEVGKLQKKIEARDKSVWPLYLRTRKWSLKKFKKVFRELGVSHKKQFYEKDIKSIGQKVVNLLLEKNIAKVGEGGAIIVDLSADKLDIGLLRKSDGAGLYLTSDLGLALVKNKYFPGVSENVHITGTEQNFYFKQLFRILELAGYKFKMTHIGYGLVNLPTGKMSSREGTVVLYDHVYDAVFEKTLTETRARHADWPTAKIKNTARSLAFAAIKFDFLKHESGKVIIFDPNSAASFDGFTGPYILYVIARILSVLEKSGKLKNKNGDPNKLAEQEEKNILLHINEFPAAVAKALENYNPSVIAKYAFDLAKLYNDFYSKHQIINASSADLTIARIALSKAALIVLKNALSLLAIEPVKVM